MNKFLIALFIAIFSFSFSNKTFAKTIIKNKNKNNIVLKNFLILILPLLLIFDLMYFNIIFIDCELIEIF